jgi:hypothetical protein
VVDLTEIIDYNLQGANRNSILNDLTITQRNCIAGAQHAMAQRKGIPHDLIVSKYASNYGLK